MKGSTNGQLHDDCRSGADAVRDSGGDGGFSGVSSAGTGHMGMKFCTSCQAMRGLAGGVFKKYRNTGRWVCQCCVERKTESIYKSQGKTNEKELRKLAARVWRYA